jgi:CNT family concentrative nucleoside transporter
MLLGYAFRPLAWLIGVPWEDAGLAGRMLGKRLVATEIPAYLDLAAAMEAGRFAHPRSPVVIAYALCGFAHVASLAIFVGGIAALVPERRGDLAAVGPRALLAATLACLMTGAVAGVFFLG